MDRQERMKHLWAWSQDAQLQKLAKRLEIELYPRHTVLADYPIDTPQAYLFWCWHIDKIPLTEEQKRRFRSEPGFESVNMAPSEQAVRQMLDLSVAAGPLLNDEIERWYAELVGGE